MPAQTAISESCGSALQCNTTNLWMRAYHQSFGCTNEIYTIALSFTECFDANEKRPRETFPQGLFIRT